MSWPQRCKVCGRVDRMNFDVPDKVWKRVVPKPFRNEVVCLPCFDFFASAKGVDYSMDIGEVMFVGEAAYFDFDITSRHKASGTG